MIKSKKFIQELWRPDPDKSKRSDYFRFERNERTTLFTSEQFDDIISTISSYDLIAYGETRGDPVFAARSRNNYTNYFRDDEKFGGRSKRNRINHSFGGQIPSAKYGKKHPEYYSLRDGKRLAPFKSDSIMNRK